MFGVIEKLKTLYPGITSQPQRRLVLRVHLCRRSARVYQFLWRVFGGLFLAGLLVDLLRCVHGVHAALQRAQLANYTIECSPKMSATTLSRDNHYVPCVHLRAFAGPDGRIFSYRMLVPDPRVQIWKPSSVRGVGYHLHLYTAVIAGAETDEFEKWLERDIETPAAEPLRIATSEGSLTPQDWEKVIRFLAAQIVRTPAHFVKNVARWRADTPKMLNEVLESAVEKLKAAKLSGTQVSMPGARRTLSTCRFE